MSIIVKGMKMPATCTRCTLDAFGYCTAVRRYSEGSATHGRASFCPLVELPEKHGRLIDADALIAKYGDWYTEEGMEEGFIGTLEMLIRCAYGGRSGGRRMKMKFGCSFVKCVTSGDGFEKGVIYPVLGNNNGINIVREKWVGRTNDPGGDSSDPYIFYACSGGVGEGTINNFDNTGRPSFDPWPSEE